MILRCTSAGAQRQIHQPAETWTEVLPSCGQKSLQEICFTRRQFHAIARPLLDGPKGRILPELAFATSKEGNNVLVKRIKYGDEDHWLVELPIAEVPPPKTVVGFSVIDLKYFDAKVVSFLFNIRSLFADDVHLVVGRIPKGRFGPADWASANRDQYHWKLGLSADFLARLLTNVRCLRIYSPPPAPQSFSLTGTCGHNCSPHIPILVEWLHSPSEDGHQKMASLDVGDIENLAVLVTQAQQHFLSATSTSIPYFVALYSSTFDYARRLELPFDTLRNEQTGEVLSLHFESWPLSFDFIPEHVVLYRRSCASPPTEESEEEELLEMQESLWQALYSTESPRNKLVLDVAQMGEFDEALFPTEDEPQNADDGSQPGPSSAKQNQIV